MPHELPDFPASFSETDTVVLHVRLKGIPLADSLGYQALTRELLNAFAGRGSRPLVVPAYTYSFTREGRFSLADSPAEVGRFSEEVRRLLTPEHRTLDPVFSHLDVNRCLEVSRRRWCREAFGADSIFAHLDQVDALVVNINVPGLFGTQLHYIERRCSVPYRYDKAFQGTVTGLDGSAHEMTYDYYVRSLDEDTAWDRDLIASHLRAQGVLYDATWLGVPVRWMRARQARLCLEKEIAATPRFLLGVR